MTEAELLKRLQLRLSDVGRFFRNHVAKGWQGEATVIERPGLYPVQRGDVVIKQGRRMASGLCVGSGDLIGWVPHTITAHDVGRTVAIFASVEAKAQHGRMTEGQHNFHVAVHRAGGIAIEARDVDETIDEINQKRRGITP